MGETKAPVQAFEGLPNDFVGLEIEANGLGEVRM